MFVLLTGRGKHSTHHLGTRASCYIHPTLENTAFLALDQNGQSNTTQKLTLFNKDISTLKEGSIFI